MTKRSTIFINFTSACNYKCVFCANRFNPETTQSISYADFVNISDLLDEYEVVDITGSGEITVHRDFAKIARVITDKKKKIRMVTNGSNIMRHFEFFKSAEFSELVISLNSLDPAIYGELTGGELQPVLDNIEFLRKERPGLNIIFSFVMTSRNFHELQDYVKFGAKYNAQVSCLGLTPSLQAHYPAWMHIADTPEARESVLEAKQRALALGVQFSCFSFDTQRSSGAYDSSKLAETIRGCTWITEYTFIETNGNVCVCCWNMEPIGSIKTQTLKEIYSGEKYMDLVARIRGGDTKYCGNCRMNG